MFEPQQLGKFLLLLGGGIALVGALLWLGGQVGLFKLPGDLEFGGKNWKLYIPLGTCILLSVLLTLILWLINHFRH